MTKEIVQIGAAPDGDLTLLEVQRWEDDGGAVAPDATPRKNRPVQVHSTSTERYRRHAQDEIAAAA